MKSRLDGSFYIILMINNCTVIFVFVDSVRRFIRIPLSKSVLTVNEFVIYEEVNRNLSKTFLYLCFFISRTFVTTCGLEIITSHTLTTNPQFV